jgi:Ca-activated chloride channel family protein
LVKRPGIVTFVVDTSGSMMGNKIDQARDGLTRALDNMARNNQVGLVTFDDSINITIPVGPLMDNRFAMADAVHEMRARGETALYDAIKVSVEMTAAAEGEENAIRAVVVLTDGRANRGQTRLDNLVEMMSKKDEASIREFGGFQNDSMAVDAYGRRVARAEVVGTKLTLGIPHVQIFFLGIGDDADMDVGRILAEATGAEFQGVSEEDLANVLEEFSKYF